MYYSKFFSDISRYATCLCSFRLTTLALADDFRTIDWLTIYPFPQASMLESKKLLGMA